MAEGEKTKTTVKGKVVIGDCEIHCPHGCLRQLHLVIECADEGSRRCRVVAVCNKCGNDGMFLLDKMLMSCCLDKHKRICPKSQALWKEKGKDTASQTVKKKRSWLARLFGR